jgi:hypothetical protein
MSLLGGRICSRNGDPLEAVRHELNRRRRAEFRLLPKIPR